MLVVGDLRLKSFDVNNCQFILPLSPVVPVLLENNTSLGGILTDDSGNSCISGTAVVNNRGLAIVYTTLKFIAKKKKQSD